MTANATAIKTDIGDWFAVPTWKPAVGGAKGTLQVADGAWLIFADAAGIGAQVADRLRGLGATASTVGRGEVFMAAPDLFTIRATERADYDALIKELHRRGELPARILHLSSLDSPSAGLTN